MSGGYYNYAYSHVNDFLDDLRQRDENYDHSQDQFYDRTYHRWLSAEESKDLNEKRIALRKWFCEHLEHVSNAMKAIEWVDSDDHLLGDENDFIAKVMQHLEKNEGSHGN